VLDADEPDLRAESLRIAGDLEHQLSKMVTETSL
jgi:hypothetical protein